MNVVPTGSLRWSLCEVHQPPGSAAAQQVVRVTRARAGSLWTRRCPLGGQSLWQAAGGRGRGSVVGPGLREGGGRCGWGDLCASPRSGGRGAAGEAGEAWAVAQRAPVLQVPVTSSWAGPRGQRLRFEEGDTVEVPLKKTVLVATFKADDRVATEGRNLQEVCGVRSRKKGKWSGWSSDLSRRCPVKPPCA